MTKYITQQKEAILDFIDRNTNFTSDKMLFELNKDKKTISKATLYRHLKELENEGIIKSFYNDELKRYEFLRVKQDKSCFEHLHLRCNKCGKILHLDCKTEIEFLNHIKKEHHFLVDVSGTYISGVCDECLKEGK